MDDFSNSSAPKNPRGTPGATFLVVAAAVLWGTLGIYGKLLHGLGFTPIQVVLIRAVGASVTLILFLGLTRPNLLKIRLGDIHYFIGTGIFSFVFFNWCYFEAINRTSLSIAAILLYTAPALVMVFSAILFKEPLTSRKLLSLCLTFIGCLLVTVFSHASGQKITPLGFLMGLGSGLGYALYSIFGRYALKKYDSLTVTVYTFIFASLALLPFADSDILTKLSDVRTLAITISMGVTATALPFLLYTKGLTRLETSRASITATLEPIVATGIGILLYGEPLTLFKASGIALVLLAVALIREEKPRADKSTTI